LVLEWIEQHPSLAAWVQSIGSIAAIGGAIWAARKAYAGAIAQATVAREQITFQIQLKNEEKLSNLRGVAAALCAELTAEMQIAADELVHFKLNDRSKDTAISYFKNSTRNCTVFNSNPSAVGLLPSALASDTVMAYCQVHSYNKFCIHHLESSSNQDEYEKRVLDEIGETISFVRYIIRTLIHHSGHHDPATVLKNSDKILFSKLEKAISHEQIKRYLALYRHD